MEARHPIQFTLRALHTYIKSYTLADMMRQMSTLSTFFWHIRRLYIDYIVTFLLRNTYLSIHIKHAGAWLPTLINDVNLEQITHQHWMTIPKFWPKLKPRLFSQTKFSETKTETFFPRPNCPEPKPKPSKIWQKSRDRDLNWDFSTSFEMKFGTCEQNWDLLGTISGL